MQTALTVQDVQGRWNLRCQTTKIVDRNRLSIVVGLDKLRLPVLYRVSPGLQRENLGHGKSHILMRVDEITAGVKWLWWLWWLLLNV
jgi:hypothetical protein